MSRTTILAASGLILLLAGSVPAHAGGVAVIGVQLTDNGDNDGFADIRETVHLNLEVRNTSGDDLTDVIVDIVSLTPTLVCTSQPTVTVGDLAAGETRLIDSFVFTVADVNRTALGLGPLDVLTAVFGLTSRASPEDPPVYPPEIAIDLDLDVGGGGEADTFFESFESSTLGSFEIQNLDEDHPGGWEGYYCQNTDARDVTCDPFPCDCSLGANPEFAAAEFWALSGPSHSADGGRGFTGFHSIYFGLDLGPPRNWTTPLGTLEAVATSEPIHVGWDDATSVLSFAHQISLIDNRTIDSLDSPVDRAVVMAQIADTDGAPAGDWIKLEPYVNGYDQKANGELWMGNCMFDPVDDGSNTDDLFPGSWNYGPSSTCSPEYAFANIGETSAPFDADNVGLADGPGLEGDSGFGTWIETEFDLSRFRGRSIRVRFLATTMSVKDPDNGNPYETWEDYLLEYGDEPNPVPGDDGWWIDDIAVTGLLSSPAVVTVDTKDNSNLPDPPGQDLDADGLNDVCDNCPMTPNSDQLDDDWDMAGNLCDCAPLDAGAFAEPEEIQGLRALTDKNSLQWDSIAAQAGPGTVYDLLRGFTFTLPVGSGITETCVFGNLSNPTAADQAQPPRTRAFYYLVRGENVCGTGSYGTDSALNERLSDACP